MKYEKLDPVLNQSVRLAIVSILLKVKRADFNYLMEKTNTTQGNMSHQLKKLKEANYIKIEKTFERNYPKTYCYLSEKGRKAFAVYVRIIKQYLDI